MSSSTLEKTRKCQEDTEASSFQENTRDQRTNELKVKVEMEEILRH